MSAVRDANVGPAIEGLTFLEMLGKGGYSYVYLYERMSPRMRVAVKVLRDGRLSPNERAQFAAEAETMAELADHPFIVQVFSTGVLDDGRPYLVMKYYPRPNLAVRAASERFAVPDVLRVGVKIASAVETAHRVGILHRDIKPANILVSQYGEPGLTDFGIAGHASDTDDGDDLGVSIPWSPPEVLNGSSNGSAQSDVYSLAATVWHLLTGRAPFEIPGGDNAPGPLMSRTLRLPVPSTGRPEVPASLERLLTQAMAKNPAVRPRTALEFARALQAIEQEQRFDRTDIVVDGLASGPPRAPSAPTAPEEDRTTARPHRPSGPPDAAPPTVARPVRPVGSTSGARPAASNPAWAPTAAPRTGSKAGASAPPTVVRPQSVPQPSAAPTSPSAPRERQTAATPVENATVQRPSTPVAEVDPAPRRRGLRRGWVAAVAAAVVVAAVAVGLVLSSGGSGKPKTAATTRPAATGPQDVLPGSGGAAPSVHAEYAAASRTVVFTWTPADRAAGARYVWYPAGQAGRTTSTSTPRVTIRTSTPASVCIQVLEVRADGSSSEPSASVCGA